MTGALADHDARDQVRGRMSGGGELGPLLAFKTPVPLAVDIVCSDMPEFEPRGVDGGDGLLVDQASLRSVLEHRCQQMLEFRILQQALLGLPKRGAIGNFLQPKDAPRLRPFGQQDLDSTKIGLEKVLENQNRNNWSWVKS